MTDDDLIALDLSAAAAAIEHQRVDPVELTDAYLRRIAATDEDLNAYLTVDVPGAIAAARRARDEIAAGHYRGPLHGIPVGVKDIIDTAGLRTTYGSARYREHVPRSDAVVVARLRSAGAVILGKHATHEFAWGGRTDNPHFGPTHNPHDPSRIPGGSSGGGAASIVAGTSLLAIGTDTAGSVRIPAALSGCVGLKPPYGWIDTAGVFPLSPALDHVGVLTRTVADSELAAGVLGYQPTNGSPGMTPFGPWRIGIVVGPSADVADAAVRAGVARAVEVLREAGAHLEDVRLEGIDERAEAILTIIQADGQRVHREGFRADPGSYGPDLAEQLTGPPVAPDELATARATAHEAADLLRDALDHVDVVIGATAAVLAPPIGDMTVDLAGRRWPTDIMLSRLTSIADVAGVPAISVPAPGTCGLPVGVQVVSRSERADVLLRAATIVEAGAG